MEIIKTSDPKRFEEYANDCLAGHEGMVIHICEEPCVWTGRQDSMDKKACENLDVGIGQYNGGSIVNMPGDVSICLTTYGSNAYAPKLVMKCYKYFKSKGLNATVNANDVLIDKKKVLSWARTGMPNNYYQSVVHFSIGKMDLELVKKICTKPMVKIPGSLEEYGITTEDILTLIT